MLGRRVRPSGVARPLRRACSTTTALRAEIAALKAQVTSLGASPVQGPEQGERSLFAGASGEYTTELKFWYPHADGALWPVEPTPGPNN